MADEKTIQQLIDAINSDDAKAAAKHMESILATMGKIRRFSAETVEELKAQARLEAELEMHSAKYLDGIEKITRQRQAQITLAQGEVDAAEKALKILKKSGDATGESLANAQKIVIEKQKELEAQKQLLGLQKDAATQGNKLAQLMFGVSGSSDNIYKTWKKMGTAGYAQSFAAGLQDALSVSNLLIAGLKKLGESTVTGWQTNDAFNTSLAKSVQLSEEGTDRVFDYSAAWSRFGASLDEAAGYYDTVFHSVVAFSNAAEDQQDMLHRNTMLFAEGMGTADSYAQAINTLTTSFRNAEHEVYGMSAATEMLHQQVIAYGEGIGLSGQQTVNMFNRVAPRLAEFGHRGVQVFQQLAAVSKMTGIEIEELSGIARGFDTFESAAGSVSQLNAILGGAYLNTLDMVNASDERRVELIRAAMQGANRNINDIHLQRAAAAALNTTTENAIKLLQGEGEALDNLHQSGLDAANQQLNMEEAAERATTASERLAIAVESANAEMARPTMTAYRESMTALADVITKVPLLLIIGGLTAIGALLGTVILPMFVNWTRAKLGIQTETTKLTGTIEGLEAALSEMSSAIQSQLVPALNRLTTDQTEAAAATENHTSASNSLTDTLEGQEQQSRETANETDNLTRSQEENLNATSRWNPKGMTMAQRLGDIAMTAGMAYASFGLFNNILNAFPEGMMRNIAAAVMTVAGALVAIHAAKAGFPLGIGVAAGLGATVAGAYTLMKSAHGFYGGEVPEGMDMIKINENAGAGRGTGGEAFIGESARRMEGGAVISQQGVAAAIGGFQQLGQAINEGNSPLAPQARQGRQADNQSREIVLKIDEREFGRAVFDVWNDNPVFRALFRPR